MDYNKNILDYKSLSYYDKKLKEYMNKPNNIWKPNVLYSENDIVLHPNKKQWIQCIVNHTSLNDFDNVEEDYWIYIIHDYFSLKESQYSYLVTNGAITAENKHLYIVEDNNDYPSEYEMDFTDLDTVLVQHNLNETFPSKVYIFDEDGNEIVLPEIEYNSMNLLTISFAFPITGKVIVKK